MLAHDLSQNKEIIWALVKIWPMKKYFLGS